jgi:PTH1 family peptidyl-tRNA hydrolase
MFLSKLFEIFSHTRLPKNAGWIIVGIGNPGPRYEQTRHNAGFMVTEALEKLLAQPKRRRLAGSMVIFGELPDVGMIIIARPLTYVNRSGEAVAALLSAAGQVAGRCLIVADDFHLPLGRLRLRRNGSDGGHNGLKSIIAAIGQDFPRLRIGTGPLPPKADSIEFVLSRFAEQELSAMQTATTAAARAVRMVCEKGIDPAMNAYN